MLLTKEEHLDYLESSVRLMLWFIPYWLKTHPEESFEQVLHLRTDIWRRTDFNNGPLDGPKDGYTYEWLELVCKLKDCYNLLREESEENVFENTAIELLKPHFIHRVERDLEEHCQGASLANYQCGSLRHNTRPDSGEPQRISFHIANACYPGSPFDNKLYLPSCLLIMVEQCAGRYGVTEISTETWLNSNPRWLELFPDEWQSNLSDANQNIRGHNGFWGQFMTARKTFNHKLGGKFRATGKLPYANRHSWCTIASLKQHLSERYLR